MVTLKLEKLEILVRLSAFHSAEAALSDSSELVYPVLGSFEYVRCSTTLNIKMLAPDIINLTRTRSFHNMISRTLLSHSVL